MLDRLARDRNDDRDADQSDADDHQSDEDLDQRQAPIVARRGWRHWIFARPVVATVTDIAAPPTGLVTVSVPAFTHGAGVAVVAPR